MFNPASSSNPTPCSKLPHSISEYYQKAIWKQDKDATLGSLASSKKLLSTIKIAWKLYHAFEQNLEPKRVILR